MKSHLKTMNLEIETLSPLYIGSGKSINKKEYIYIEKGHRVLILDNNKFFNFLVKKNLIPEYEKFMLREQKDLYKWLIELNIRKEELELFKSYEINASDAIIADKTLKEINLFIKDKYIKPYVPGSSLKGYIKTAILSKFISEDKSFSSKVYLDMKNKLTERKLEFKNEEREIETKYINKLPFESKKERNGSINSLMRGIQISDSEPIDIENIILCTKIDYKKDKSKSEIDIFRECIKPNTVIRHTFTYDHDIFKQCKIDIQFIKNSIKEFYNIQKKYHIDKFIIDNDFEKIIDEEYEIYLGGGAGYNSKTLSYSLGNNDVLHFVSKIMDKKFKDHKHYQDVDLGISPRTLKCTKYNNKYYIMGRCKILFNEA
ncbi:UNVERIFIED_CONTAM: CRISPR-associated protein Csm5 [Acetivibrio alkalicellulosi]